MRKYLFRPLSYLLFLGLFLGGVLGLAQVDHHDAYAGIEVIGKEKGATDALYVAGTGGKVRRIVFFTAGVKTPTGANTPIVSDPVCGLGSFTLYRADAYLVGTMSGTAPTAAIKWRHSTDGGAHWTDVGTWTTINATVTPASQSQTVSDIYNATTAVAYGDCWDAVITMGGTTPGINLEINGFAK